MAAPNLETLYDFETNIESAAKTFLETATGLSASSLYASLDQDTYTLPRITINYEDSGAIDPFDLKPDDSGDLEYLKFNGTLQISIITDASQDNTASNHRTIRGKVRGAMMISGDNWTASNLPYYDINYMRPAGTSFDVDGDLAVSVLTYQINVVIRNDAFPST